jgi:hypothetical protein
MKKHDNSQKTVLKQYTPVKPFAFDAWEIWNNLTTAAELLWEEHEVDFIEFCCNNTPMERKKQTTEDHVPF